jgi:uncharacterized protein (TIGR03437 family)
MRRLSFTLGWCLALVPVAGARQDPRSCGTHPEIGKERLHLHRQAVRARGRIAGARLEAAARPASRDAGQIVVLEDTDGVVGRLNPFNLDRRTLAFLPSAAAAERYRFRAQEASYDAAAATAGARVSLGDDDSSPATLPFPFPFFGATYQRMFVNSDGNLTFVNGDNASSDRSLGRVTAGPPRIAGLFRDLDPSMSTEGVRLLLETGRVVVSWSRVPEYREFGVGPLQTFQIRLYPDGRIEAAFEGVSTQEAVVGISPGRLQGSSSVVSFADGSSQEYASTLAERFSGAIDIDVVLAAQKFYETHEDAYDFLVLFNNMGIEALDSAVAYELTVRTARQGIGDVAIDVGREYGSASRLQSVMNMGPMSQYPADPYAVVPRRGFARDTTMSVIAHEAGHLFLAYASIRDPSIAREKPMLCSDQAHWSFAFNAEASLLSGNRIRDNGTGVVPRFTTVATVESYAPLDRYLMGLIPPAEVPPTFLVKNASNASSCLPMPGISFDGERRDIAIEEIAGAEGRRTPDHTVSQRRYRFAFILVVAKGSDPPPSQLAQLETYRQEFESFFRRSTGDLAWGDTGLRKSLKLSVFPAAGVLVDGSIGAGVSVAAPPAAPLTVSLKTAHGAASTPPSVTIPAGATSAKFTIRGLRAGVEELTAEAADTGYETAAAFVQVAGSSGDLKLAVESGDRQIAQPGTPLAEAIAIRVVDRNNLPYQGLTVRAAVSPGGSVAPASAETGDDGVVRFTWTPGPGSFNELTATLDGAPGVAPARVTALGRPAVAAGGVVSAASYAPGLAPGSLASIFGASLAGGATAQAARPLPLQLAGVRVLLDGRAAQLIYASDRQVNFLVPSSLAEGETSLVVATPLGDSPAVRVPVLTYLPGLFFDPGSGLGAVLQRGEFLEVYATGLGPVRPSSIVGLEETLAAPNVLVDNQPAEVPFSGLAPGFPGLYQVNVRLPRGLAPGPHKLGLEIGGRRANEVTVVTR